MTTTYTHYRVIERSDGGIIRPVSPRKRLGRSGLGNGLPGVYEARVAEVLPDTVAGWGDAAAIGLVERMINGRPIEAAPVLALLYQEGF